MANSIIGELTDKYGSEVARKASSKMEKFGFKFATIMAPSFGLDEFEIPDEI